MKPIALWLTAGWLAAATASPAQPMRCCGQGRGSPLASNPVVELKGKITKVRITPGEGMPFLEVESNGRAAKVLLGPIRFLMEQNFRPKAGEQVEVRGFRISEDIVASSVTLGGSTLRLRDDAGWPLWRGGMRGRMGMGRGSCCGPSAFE